jgi:hypothetical protein
MECFGTTDFDSNSRMITLSAIIIRGLHCIYIVDEITDVAPLYCMLKTLVICSYFLDYQDV